MSQMPTLKQLQYLLALDETRHFGQAAERCGISQPSLSVQISNLEALLRIKLIGRDRGAVIPTAAGRDVVRQAREIVQATQRLTEASQHQNAGLSVTIRLGVSSTLGPYLLPAAVRLLRQDHPDLKLYIREAIPNLLLEDFARGEHDFILTQIPVAGRDYDVARLFREPLLLTVPADHPLAARKTVTETDLTGLSMMSLGSGYVLHEKVRLLCENHGAVLQTDYTGTSLDALRAMTALGMGCCLLPALYVMSEISPKSEPIQSLPFKGNRIARSVGLVARRKGGNARSFEALAALFRRAAADQKAPGLRIEQ